MTFYPASLACRQRRVKGTLVLGDAWRVPSTELRDTKKGKSRALAAKPLPQRRNLCVGLDLQVVLGLAVRREGTVVGRVPPRFRRDPSGNGRHLPPKAACALLAPSDAGLTQE